MKIYVASSWRNVLQPSVVTRLREEGHSVYDFRHPTKDNDGFSWAKIDPNWLAWDPRQFRAALDHPIAKEGFSYDIKALEGADATVLVLPCGRSAHLELGYAAGRDQRTFILATEPTEPELMYLMCESIAITIDELVAMVRRNG